MQAVHLVLAKLLSQDNPCLVDHVVTKAYAIDGLTARHSQLGIYKA